MRQFVAKKTFGKIFLISLALVITTYFTRKHFSAPFVGAGICLAFFIFVTLCGLFIMQKRVGREYISAKQVSAFKMFEMMQMFAKLAFYFVALCFFNIVLMDSEQSLSRTLNYLLICVVAFCGGLLAIYFSFAKRVAKTFDCINVFVFGSAIWLFASVLLYNNFFKYNAIGYVLCLVGIGFVYASLKHIGNNVQQAMEVVSYLPDKRFKRFCIYSDIKALLFAQVVLLCIMIVFQNTDYSTQLFSDALLLTPGVFLAIACVFACLQPLDKKGVDKLVVYRTSLGEEKEKELIRNSLAEKVIKTKNKIGIRVMTWFVRPFFKSKCVGKEKIKKGEGPVIFVANHYEIYGPIIAVLRMPASFRPWVINEMIDDQKIEDQMVGGIDKIRFLPKGVKKRLPKVIKRLIKYIITAMEPIPVYKGNLREVITTINLTVEAMQSGDNIMLFPEKPDVAYNSEGGVDKFYSGFVEIGAGYYKKTGKSTTFYPVYISKKKKKLFIGDGIKYNACVPKTDEKRRIANLLHERMQNMANGCKKKTEKDD